MNRRNGKKENRSPAGRNADLAKIHIAKAQLGLDDDTYREMLWSVARVRSAAKLDAGGRAGVLAHLRAVGWKDAGRPPSSTRTRYEKGTPAALIRWLWTQLFRAGLVGENTDRALRHYIAQHGGLRRTDPVDEIAPQHLVRHEASKIIEQLKSWLEREAKPAK